MLCPVDTTRWGDIQYSMYYAPNQDDEGVTKNFREEHTLLCFSDLTEKSAFPIEVKVKIRINIYTKQNLQWCAPI